MYHPDVTLTISGLFDKLQNLNLSDTFFFYLKKKNSSRKSNVFDVIPFTMAGTDAIYYGGGTCPIMVEKSFKSRNHRF